MSRRSATVKMTAVDRSGHGIGTSEHRPDVNRRFRPVAASHLFSWISEFNARSDERPDRRRAAPRTASKRDPPNRHECTVGRPVEDRGTMRRNLARDRSARSAKTAGCSSRRRIAHFGEGLVDLAKPRCFVPLIPMKRRRNARFRAGASASRVRVDRSVRVSGSRLPFAASEDSIAKRDPSERVERTRRRMPAAPNRPRRDRWATSLPCSVPPLPSR